MRCIAALGQAVCHKSHRSVHGETLVHCSMAQLGGSRPTGLSWEA